MVLVFKMLMLGGGGGRKEKGVEMVMKKKNVISPIHVRYPLDAGIQIMYVSIACFFLCIHFVR